MRAARRLWATLVKEKFHPQSEKSLLLRTHCQTSGWSLTAADPFNNVVRTTVEAMAAVLGGTQSLHTNSFDEAVSLPTPFSSHLARNTQLILQEEAMLPKIVDPWGGSYFMESLTAEIESSARKLIDEIEGMGGMAKAVASGMPKQRIEEASLLKQSLIDSGVITIIGVNKHKPEAQIKTDSVQPLKIDNSAVLANQLKRLKTVKQSRDNAKVQAALDDIVTAAKSNSNLLQVCVEAARIRCTVGEISSALESVFTRFTPKSTLLTGTYNNSTNTNNNEEISRTIKMCDEFASKHGRRPRILVAKIGQDGHDRGAKVIASSFADMGFDVEIGPLFQVRERVEGDCIILMIYVYDVMITVY